MIERDPGRSGLADRGLFSGGLLILAVLVTAADIPSHAQPHADGAPPGHTGGFGEPTCHGCHNEYPLNLDGTFSVDGIPETYTPGASYLVTLTLASEGMEIAGFQGAFRSDDATPAGEVAALDRSITVLRTTADSVVTYVQHASGGVRTDGAATARWEFIWTAPPTGRGPISFHAAANSGNGDNSPLGDIVYTVHRVSAEATTPPGRESP